ncbi:MAG: hypothetical protein H7Y00_06535 [Fimbriimonadaceae bacterium]|nr:hypothetical protein [Chitinophagales bacterium]
MKQKEIITAAIKDTSGFVITTLTDTAESGINYLKYDLSINETAVTTINQKLKSSGSKTETKKADDKKYYLIPGKYFIEIRAEGTLRAEKEFLIEEKK